jgi:putative transposase
MEPYSLDLRERIVKAVHQGMSKTQVAAVYNVGRATVYRYMSLEALGELSPKVHPGPGRRLDEAGCQKLLKQVVKYADLSLEEHAEKFATHHTLTLKKSSIANYFERLNVQRKKNTSGPRA